MTGLLGDLTLRRLDRPAIQRFLPLLSDWLLPGAIYSVQHTWPQLYRADGGGTFYALFDQERLVSHLAVRQVDLQGTAGHARAALIGSVATAPAERGRGLAGHLLTAAVQDAQRDGCDVAMLWAERPELYARAGFSPGAAERCAVLDGLGAEPRAGVRLATVADHDAIHELHRRNPLRVRRTPRMTSGLLTTPGLWTAVLEQDGAVAAYACSGKGADLQGWWHELGGPDELLARLLPAAMALVQQSRALLLLPPHRPRLAELLADRIRETSQIPGPMVRVLTPAGAQGLYVDGLDSV